MPPGKNITKLYIQILGFLFLYVGIIWCFPISLNPCPPVYWQLSTYKVFWLMLHMHMYVFPSQVLFFIFPQSYYICFSSLPPLSLQFSGQGATKKSV